MKELFGQSCAKEKVVETQKRVFFKDIPLVLENTTLVSDPSHSVLYLHCTFRSMSEVAVKAVMVEIECQDVWGNTLGQPFQYQYLDLCATSMRCLVQIV